MDLMTDLPPTDDGYDTLLVIVDHGLSKGIILVPTTKTVKSAATKNFFFNLILLMGQSEKALSVLKNALSKLKRSAEKHRKAQKDKL
jgi:hypothetical protein